MDPKAPKYMISDLHDIVEKQCARDGLDPRVLRADHAAERKVVERFTVLARMSRRRFAIAWWTVSGLLQYRATKKSDKRGIILGGRLSRRTHGAS